MSNASIEFRVRELVSALSLINADIDKQERQLEGRFGKSAMANLKRLRPIRDGIEARIEWLFTQAGGRCHDRF